MALLDRRGLLMLGGGLALSLRTLGTGALEASAGLTYAVQMQTLKYASPDGMDLSLDLYLPQGAPGPLPLIVFLHGGRWSQGNRTTGPDFKRFFAQDGIAMAAIDYRLTPTITFPKNAEDVKTAIRWLRANAGSYNLDPRRIGLWGTSAGGHLATVAAVTPAGLLEGEGNLDQSSAVQCVLDAYGPVLFDVMDQQIEQERATLQTVNAKLAQYQQSRGMPAIGPQQHDHADSPESKLVGAPLQTVRERVRAASPLNYLTDQAPPFLIMHGLADNSVPHHQSIMLYEALSALGKDVTLRLVDGLPHSFMNVSDLDTVAGPFQMQVRMHRDSEVSEWTGIETASIFDVSREFFRRHLQVA
jgi:acetyl esterase/lipase